MPQSEFIRRIANHRPPSRQRHLPHLEELLRRDGVVDPRVLDVGSGGRTISPRTVRLDVARQPNVDVQGDAVRLPVRDASVDAVVATDVLMYVSDPVGAVREIARVLKPGGWVYASEPFLYPDMGRGTFRFTQRGLEGLFAGFEIAEARAHRGPGSVALPIFDHYVATLLSFGWYPLYRLLLYGMLVLTYPLSFLDDVLLRHRAIPARVYTECVVFARKPRVTTSGGGAAASGAVHASRPGATPRADVAPDLRTLGEPAGV